MSAFPRVLSYQNSFLGSKFVVIGVVCCQEMRRNALFHKVLRVLTKYFYVIINAFYKLLLRFVLRTIDFLPLHVRENDSITALS